jgi:hypothetical protein
VACARLPCAAQEPSGSPATTTIVPRWALGDPAGDRGDLPPELAVLPLRLSLQSSIFPISPALGQDACAPNGDPSGNTIHGFPIQRSTMIRLSPRLTLHGFSTTACPLDSAAGGGLTYVAPLRKDLWLVGSAGVYGVPAHAPLPARIRNDVRLDLVTRAGPDRTLSVGIGRRGIKLGGSF